MMISSSSHKKTTVAVVLHWLLLLAASVITTTTTTNSVQAFSFSPSPSSSLSWHRQQKQQQQQHRRDSCWTTNDGRGRRIHTTTCATATATATNRKNSLSLLHMASTCSGGVGVGGDHHSLQDDYYDNFKQFRKQKASDKKTRRMQRFGSGDAASASASAFIDMDRAAGRNIGSSSTGNSGNNNGINDEAALSSSFSSTVTMSPMQQAGNWNHKKLRSNRNSFPSNSSSSSSSGSSTASSTTATSGTRSRSRSRSKKRSQLYSSLSSYQNKFLTLLTEEYRVEEEEVMGRIKSSLDDPLKLELSGHALYDMTIERRGNLFNDEIYRLTKAHDASTNIDDLKQIVTSTSSSSSFSSPSSTSEGQPKNRNHKQNKQRQQLSLPPNHKFSANDVILLTLQPLGSGDVFDGRNLPTSESAISTEARVTSTGPYYIDIAVPAGMIEATFDSYTSYSRNGGLDGIRLRADRFFSDVPYRRMVDAVVSMASIPNRRPAPSETGMDNGDANDGYQEDGSATSMKTNGKPTRGQERNNKNGSHMAGASSRNKQTTASKQEKDVSSQSTSPHANICMDDVLRDVIISTHAFSDPSSPLFHDMDSCNLQNLGPVVAKPPMSTSVKLANEVLTYVQSNPDSRFNPLNAPQLAAVGAALTRKLTVIQGPPGTGKTSTASVIGFGFTHQCRSISRNAKVLATAFSNVGADNLASGFMNLGLKIVRIGKASAVSEGLWDHTLDAAIARDPDAQSALENAARATAELTRIRNDRKGRKGRTGGSSGLLSERAAQDIATAAVKQSIKACNIAATKAIRDADIVVSTSTGAADPRLLAACGLNVDVDVLLEMDQRNVAAQRNTPRATSLAGKTPMDIRERTDAPDGLPPISLPFVIVDEACQSVEPGTLIPVTASNSCRSLVMLGDPCQLPATVKSDPNSLLSISLMERLAAALPAPMIKMKDETTTMDRSFIDTLPVRQAKSLVKAMEARENIPTSVSYRKRFAGSLLLSIQYRMHPSIAALPSSIFYDGLLSTPSGLDTKRPFPPILNEVMPCDNANLNVRFLNVGGRCNEKRGGSSKSRTSIPLIAPDQTETTFQNEAEALEVVEMVKKIITFDQQYDPDSAKTIGLVSPYTGQVQLLKSTIENDADLSLLLANSATTIEVNSVDGYQGRERDVIIFSAVRSNRRGNVGFLSDWRRLNVALTRAKSALVVVGDIETLESDRHWAAFIKWCRGTDCITNK